MDLTGHPTHFPQLEIMCPFPALAASPSRYASVSPSWSMRKRSHHCRRRESNRSRRSNTSPHPPDLVVFPHVRFIIASPRPTLAMPVKIIVRPPSSIDSVGVDLIPGEPPDRAVGSTPERRPWRRRTRCAGRCRAPPLDPSHPSPIGWWRFEDRIPFHVIKS
jgi:hypothetical protein